MGSKVETGLIKSKQGMLQEKLRVNTVIMMMLDDFGRLSMEQSLKEGLSQEPKDL